MKRKSLLAGIMTLAVLGGCVLAVDASESKREASAASRRQTVRLLQEKLGYLVEVEHKLGSAVKEAKAETGVSPMTLRDMEVRLLEARARRVNVQVKLAGLRTPKKSKRRK